MQNRRLKCVGARTLNFHKALQECHKIKMCMKGARSCKSNLRPFHFFIDRWVSKQCTDHRRGRGCCRGPYHTSWSTEAPDCALMCSPEHKRCVKTGKLLISLSYHNAISYLPYNLYGQTRYSNHCECVFPQVYEHPLCKSTDVTVSQQRFKERQLTEKHVRRRTSILLFLLSHSLIVICRLIINSQNLFWLHDCCALPLPIG